MKRWTPLLTILIAVALALLVVSAVQACPMCKDSIAVAKNDVNNAGGRGGNGSVSGGFNLSIYIMLGGFLGTVSLVAFNLVRGMRR